jgi:hypothetical protein
MYTFNYGNQLSALSNSELSPFIVEQLKISKCRNVPISLYYCSSIKNNRYNPGTIIMILGYTSVSEMRARLWPARKRFFGPVKN